AMTVVPADRVFRTINLNVNFIRVGRAHPLDIEAVVVAQTRQMLTVRATLKREDGELIAEASAQQTLQSMRRSGAGTGRLGRTTRWSRRPDGRGSALAFSA